jgi:hypothetical protein
MEADNFEFLVCGECNGQIQESELQERPGNLYDRATICDECLEVGIHRRCMSSFDLANLVSGEGYTCAGCQLASYQVSSSDSS